MLEPNESQVHEDTEQPEAEDTPTGEQAAQGPLLDLPDAEAAEYAVDLWKSQDPTIAPLAAQWEANKLRRKGRRDVHVIKDEEGSNGWRVYVPLLQVGTPSYPNRSDQTISEILSALLVDEPKPDALPAGDSDEDRDAAEYTTRVLESETGESGLNLREALYGAADLSATTASGFLWWYTDPFGGGHEPQQVRAHPQAQRVEEADTGPMGAPPVPSADYVLRYVMPDGSLSQSSAAAVRSWRPKIRREWLSAHNVRFLPYLVGGLADANGVLIARPTTWGQLVARYPDVEKLSDGEQTQIVSWSLGKDRLLYPDHVSRRRGEQARTKDGKIRADTPVLVLTAYYKACAEYPNGCYAVFVGGKYRIHATPWSLQWEDEAGKAHEDMRDIPLAQVRWKPDHSCGNPYGVAVMDELGPLEELLATVDGGIQQLIYQALNPNVLLPLGSAIQPEAWGRRDGTPIPFNGQAGQPFVEPAPAIPQYVLDRAQALEGRMDRVSGSAPSLRGLTSPNVTSGEQEKTLIEQALVMVSNLRHTMEDCYERSCRIITQEMKAEYTVPQMLRYLSDDGSFKYEEWTGADLGSTRDVRVRRGTFTMMSPSAKAAYIDQLAQAQMLPLEKANRLKRGAVDALIGSQDDPHYLRIKRQLRAWKDGPSEEVKAQSQQFAQQLQMMPPPPPQMGPDGQPVQAPPPPDPMFQAAMAIFNPLPVDAEPEAARTRWLELSDTMAGTSFATYPEPWRQAYLQVYDMARQAAGVTTLAEQQQMQAQQQQAQQQAAQQQQAAKTQDDEAKHVREMQKLEVRAAQADDRDARKLARDMEREAMAGSMNTQPFA